MRRERLWCGATALSFCLAILPVARATYSIAATDSATQQVGGAVTSCVGSLDVGVVYASAPGRGVVHAQAQLDRNGRGKNRAVELLMQGVAPNEIIAQITQASLDPGFASRQYGVVDVMGRADGFSGERAQAYKADQQASTGTFTYSVQGNILTSQKVLDQAADAFEGEACDLAERLMRALEAGGANGEGDSCCTGGGIPTDAAFIQVDRPGEPAGSYLRLSVSNTAPANPLPRLRAMFDAWRRTHPCPSGPASVPDAGATPEVDDAGSAPTVPTAGTPAPSVAGRAASPATASAGTSAAAPSAAGVSGALPAAPASAGTGAAGLGPAAVSGGVGSLSQPTQLTPARKSSSGCNVLPAAFDRKRALASLVLLGVAAVTLRRRTASRFRRSRS